MRLAIRHRTEVATAVPAFASVQYVRLTPRADPVQRVVDWRLTMPGNVQPWTDGFGNLVHTVVMAGPHDRLVIEVEGEVDTTETWGVVPLSGDGVPPEAFLRATAATEFDAAIRDFSAPFLATRARGTLPALHALMSGIHESIAAGTEDGAIAATAAETLALRSGGSPGHAHLFIACCRAWGLPARYVSGYLHIAAEDIRQVATHGWAEALVEDLGWVSFDPFNARSATHAYVRLAVAFDAEGAAPVRTVHRGGGEARMHVELAVQAADDGQ